MKELDPKAINAEIRRLRARAKKLGLREQSWELFRLLLAEGRNKKLRSVKLRIPEHPPWNVAAHIHEVEVEDVEIRKEIWATLNLNSEEGAVFEFEIFDCSSPKERIGEVKRFIDGDWVTQLTGWLSEAKERSSERYRKEWFEYQQAELREQARRFGIKT